MALSTPSPDEAAVRALYAATMAGWNSHDAQAQAAPFAADGAVIGFDGSEMHGRAEIARTVAGIFASHVTAPYTTKVRGVRFDTLARICEVLECQPGDLLEFRPGPDDPPDA